MNMVKQLNDAMEYLEQNLCDEFSLDEMARRACVSTDSFLRFFSYMTGMTLNEYIRRRKLSRAADDLREGSHTVLEIAVKYGYDSADAFSRAFARQHGLTPGTYRKNGGSLKIYPPASFHIIIKGASELNFQIIEQSGREVFGISKPFTGQDYNTREELRHILWAAECDDVPGQLCEGEWNQPGNTAYDGLWYGVWQGGRYLLAREKKDIRPGILLEKCAIPGDTYAVFRSDPGTLAWEELPRLFEQIFDSWLPGSGYRQKGDLILEVYHLWTDDATRRKKRYYEVWLPVEKKK